MKNIPVLAFLLILCGCGTPKDPCGEPDYEAGMTDEAWRSLVDAEGKVQSGHPSAPQLSAPTEGQAVSSASKLTLSWSSPIARVPTRFPAKESFSLTSLFISEAHAHGTPLTDDGYHLRIDIPGQSCPYSVVTNGLSHTISDSGWQKMKDAKGPMSIRITSAYFSSNRVTEGPYRPADPRTFTVQ